VSMFRSAIENDKRSTRKVKARYRISLARCEYRAGDAAKARGTQDVRRALDEAEQNLKGVVGAGATDLEAPPAAEERAEAWYWLAKVYALQPNREDEAAKAFDGAVKVKEQGGDWYGLALLDGAEFEAEREI